MEKINMNILYDPLWNNYTIKELKINYNINSLDWNSGECYEGSFVLEFDKKGECFHAMFDGIYRCHAQLGDFCFVQNTDYGLFIISLLEKNVKSFIRKEMDFEWMYEHPINSSLLIIEEYGIELVEVEGYNPNVGFIKRKPLLDVSYLFPEYELSLKHSNKNKSQENHRFIYLEFYLKEKILLESKFDLLHNEIVNIDNLRKVIDSSNLDDK